MIDKNKLLEDYGQQEWTSEDDRSFWEKIEDTPVAGVFLRNLKKLYYYVKDPNVNWMKKALPIAALAYFIMPLDAIPDLTQVIGYLDDSGIVAMVVAYMAKELDAYEV